MKNNRLKLAFAIAPLSVPIVWAFVSATEGWTLIILSVATIFSYIGMIIVGLPALYILRKFSCLNLVTLGFFGLIGGILIFAIIGYILGLGIDSSSPFDLMASMWGGLLGLLVAIVFGLIAGVEKITYNKQMQADKLPAARSIRR